MSLDQRLRSGLESSSAVVRPDVEDRLVRAHSTVHRRRVVRRTSVAVAAALAVGVVVAAGPALRDTLDRTGVAPPATTATPLPTDDVAQTLVGEWRSEAVNEADVRGALEAAGYARYADVVVAELGVPTSFTLRLTDASFSTDDGRQQTVDRGVYTTVMADGDVRTLTLSAACRRDGQPVTCRASYRAELAGDALLLTLVAAEGPRTLGVPDAAFQAAIYTTSAFTRVTPPSSR